MKKIAIALVFVLTIELIPYKIFAQYQDSQVYNDAGGSWNFYPTYKDSANSLYIPTPPTVPFSPSYDISSISEKLFSASFDTSKVGLFEGYDASYDSYVQYYYLVQDPAIDSQNTEIFSNSLSQYFYAKQTYSGGEYPLLSETARTIGVKYVGNKQVSVTVTPRILQDDYAMVFVRYGPVVGVYDGDLRNGSAYIYKNWDGTYYTDSGGVTLFYADGALYKDGKTYFINWATSWDWSKSQNPNIGFSIIGSDYDVITENYSPYAKKISSQEIFDSTAVSSVTRPLNSDIVFLTQPKCVYDSDDSWFETTSSVSCDTYGLSADGRAGSAHYYDEQSSFGGILGGIAIILGSVVLTVVLPGFGGLIAATGGVTALLTLADPVVQSASIPGALGTVESSNNLGVGNWTWWGGFKTEPTVDLLAPSPIELPDSVIISWASKDADSCFASGDWSGDKTVSNGFTTEYIPKPKGIYSFTITCSNAYGSASKTAIVEVIRAPRCSFSAAPSEIELPESSTLSWDCQYPNGGSSADSCSIDNGIGSVSNVSGNIKVRPTKSTAFTLSCSADIARSFQATVNIKTFSPKYQEINPR